MRLTKNQRFGLIVFLVLLVLAWLVTQEPWKRYSPQLGASALPAGPPANIRIAWEDLGTGYPQTSTTDTICSYAGFDLGYNEQYEQAAWVAYELTRSEVESALFERTENFRSDPAIGTGSSDPADYRGSGFDRGHLAPAADMAWDGMAMSESFLMSNMSPQEPSFNRGVWRRLEEQVRQWAVEKERLYIITGPVLEGIDSLIGSNGVGVPRSYFKVLVDLSPPDHSMIAFLIPNQGSSEGLDHFVLAVDSLERLTGYDFFAVAPDQEVIEWLERQADLSTWNF